MTDIMKTPRTRRELRDALSEQKFEASRAKNAAERDLQAAKTRTEAAEYALDTLGFERHPDAAARIAFGMIQPHEAWGRKADAPELMEVSSHHSVIAEVSAEVQAATRRETLTAVIDALEIKGYLSGGFVGGKRNGEIVLDTDRFWSDLQTALDVRAERKRAESRASTEEKVARLAPPQQLSFFFPKDSFDVAAPRTSDLAFSSAFARDTSGRVHVGFDVAEAVDGEAAGAEKKSDAAKTITPEELRAAIADRLASGMLTADELRDIATISEGVPRSVVVKKHTKKKSTTKGGQK